MKIGADTLDGSEWIDGNQRYFQFQLAEDGIYKLELAALEAYGIPVTSIEEDHWQLWCNGQLVAIHRIYDENEELEGLQFIGKRNRSSLDSFLFDHSAEDLLHPDYSLITDSASYYLSWSADGPHSFFKPLDPDLGSAAAPEAYYTSTYQLSFHDRWVKPYFKLSGANVYRSNYLRGEGFALALTNEYQGEISLDHPYLGEEANMSLRFLGDYDPHLFSVTIDQEEVYREAHPSFDLVHINIDLPADTYEDTFEWGLKGNVDNLDRFHLAEVRVQYPRQPILGDQKYTQGRAVVAAPYFQFQADADEWHYYDESGKWYYKMTQNGGHAEVWASASLAGHSFHILKGTAQAISDIKEIDLVETASLRSADFIILTSKKYRQNGVVDEYAEYRNSEAGGSYQTAILNYEDLVHFWGWGIPRHPQGIRNLAYWLAQNNPNQPKIFIIGKGREYRYVRNPEELAAPEHEDYAFPTYGYPSSDHLLFAEANQSAPRFAMGRLSISSEADIRDYLAKVRAKEAPQQQPTFENSYWKKRMIHLEGGGSLSPLVSNYMDNMSQIISGSTWSPEITVFNRLSSTGIEKPVTDQVFDLINEGVSLVTFIGHSATTNLDFDINNPDKYENYGTFPMLIALGCYSGNINTAQESIGEVYTSYENGGFIASLATSGVGELTQLYLFSRTLYQTLGEHAHEWTIGDLILEALETRQNFDARHTAQLMLYGDPALRLFEAEGPDYTFDINSLTTDPQRIDNNTDSIEVSIDVVNLGTYSDVEVPIALKHKFGDGQEVLYRDTLAAIAGRAKLSQKIGINSREGLNVNELDWTLDPDEILEEYPSVAAKNNNNTSSLLNDPLSFYVFSNGIRIEQPYRYAIVGDETVELSFSTNDPLQESTTYYIELATSKEYDQDGIFRDTLTDKGALLSSTVPQPLDSGQVYFWRVGFDRADGEREWQESSFIVLPGKSGWNQSHPRQFEENPICDYLWYDEEMFFGKQQIFAEILNTYKGNGIGLNGIIYNGVEFRSVRTAFRQIDEGIAISVFDTLQNFFQPNTEALYGSQNPSGAVIHAYPFPTATLEDRAKVITFLQNHIPEHSYVFVYTIADDQLRGSRLNIQEWLSDTTALGTSIVHELEQLGAENIREVAKEGIDIYTYAFKMGAGKINEGFTTQEFEFLRVGMTLSRRLVNGQLKTEPIVVPGLDSILLEWKATEIEEADYNQIQILNANATSIYSSKDYTDTIPVLVESGSAIIDYFSADSTMESTCPPLDHIRLYYSPLQDWLWAPKHYFEISASPVILGQSLNIGSAIRQIGKEAGPEAIPVSILLIQSGKIIADTTVYASKKDGFYILDYALSTQTFEEGIVDIRMEINPGQEFEELSSENNLLNTSIYLQKDRIKPELTVQLEGRLMKDGQIAPYQPHFTFSLWDFDSPIPLEQTDLNWQCTQPDGTSYELASQEIEANSLEQNAHQGLIIDWFPQFTQTGRYQLELTAQDQSENVVPAFSATFEIRDQGNVENIQIQPNPNNGRFQLHYDFTSSQLPDDAEFFLIDMNGKVWMQFPLSDFLEVGRNHISEPLECYSCVAGTYLFQIRSKGELIKEGKVVIIE